MRGQKKDVKNTEMQWERERRASGVSGSRLGPGRGTLHVGITAWRWVLGVAPEVWGLWGPRRGRGGRGRDAMVGGVGGEGWPVSLVMRL